MKSSSYTLSQTPDDSNSLAPSHLVDLQASAIEPDILQLNFDSVAPEEAFHFLINEPSRRNDGRLRDGNLQLWHQLQAGAWRFRGIDLLTMQPDLWGCLKPDTPRLNADGKPIKYEHPHGTITKLFALRVNWRRGRKIIERSIQHLDPARQSKIRSEYLDRAAALEGWTLDLEDKSFWQFVIDHPEIPVTIAEGAKKAASLMSAGILAIGLPGIYGGYRKLSETHRALIPELAALAQRGREFGVATG